jgi:excinuclease UvrABC nuclease subunit
MSGELVLYVGKTINLKNREYKHRHKQSNTTSSRYIPSYIDWEMALLEESSTDTSKVREQYWIDQLKPLYNEIKAYNPLSHLDRVKEYQATEKYKSKVSAEEYKVYNREAQRKHKAKKRTEIARRSL